MTDLRTIKDMLTRARIKFTEDAYDQSESEIVFCITVEDGYAGFFSTMEFRFDGSLIAIKAWE